MSLYKCELRCKMDHVFQCVVFSTIYPITAFKMYAERGNHRDSVQKTIDGSI